MSRAPRAPGILKGNLTRATSVVRTTASAVRPTTGEFKISIKGRKLIKTNAIAASDPSSPALGRAFRIQLEPNAQIALKIPLMKMQQMPMCHAYFCAKNSCSSVRLPSPPRSAFIFINAGPRTKRTIPKVLGVSRPRGMAVTLPRPSLRARRNAT